MKVYLFNPDNDLALSNGDANYMAPASARKMADDLSLLPLWYAPADAVIMSNSVADEEWIDLIERNFGVVARLISENELKTHSSLKLCPWGWNTTLIRLAKLWGFPENSLPNKEEMDQMREFSHRSVAVSLLSRLNISSVFCGESFCLTTDDQVRAFVESYPRVLLKAPWSGSGKGLRPGKGEYTFHIQQWAHRIIKNQRCVIGEPYYDKVEDFAMEFFCDEVGNINFVGYSLFETDGRGAYKGNVLATDEMIEQRLGNYVSIKELCELRISLIHQLQQLLAYKYVGYLGIDMMICQFDESTRYCIHPCVEINLRRNMGLFARQFYDRYIQSGGLGMYRVDFFQNSDLLIADHKDKLSSNPLVVEDEKIVSGYLSLTPVVSGVNYRASIWVER